MKTYLISPKAPLMFRDGRGFDADSSIAETLAFPRPSTLAGAIRTAWAESQNNFNYHVQGKTLLDKMVQGPLLTEISSSERKILLPTPADSICLADDQGNKMIYRLKPAEINQDNEGTNLPNDDLMPVFLPSEINQKPANNAPAFWYLEQFIDWLADDHSDAPLPAEPQGVAALPIEVRTHVSIDPGTYTNKASHLYQTAGIDFSQGQLHDDKDENILVKQLGWEKCHYGLLMQFSDKIPDGLRTIGGEARLGQINMVDGCWPKLPKELKKKLADTTLFRMHLVTPAIFTNGYLPGFIDKATLHGKLDDLDVILRAAALPRWQAGTSWNMLKGKTGKGMRRVQRLVPAGSVYWFEIKNGDAKQLANYWLTSISDERKNDGYGLVVPGIWTK
ncbi:MAG: CRISPR-associated protein Cmr3 [Nitrosomonas sp.]|nr:MAG: CRISPR-associated protein Cmr3 [Nitrosomonas sp.]